MIGWLRRAWRALVFRRRLRALVTRPQCRCGYCRIVAPVLVGMWMRWEERYPDSKTKPVAPPYAPELPEGVGPWDELPGLREISEASIRDKHRAEAFVAMLDKHRTPEDEPV